MPIRISCFLIHPCVFESEILFFTLILAEKLGLLILGDAIYTTRNAAIASPFTFFSSCRFLVGHCRVWVKGFQGPKQLCLKGHATWTKHQWGVLERQARWESSGEAGRKVGCTHVVVWTWLLEWVSHADPPACHTGVCCRRCQARGVFASDMFGFQLSSVSLSPTSCPLFLSSPLLAHPFLYSTLSILNYFSFVISPFPLFLLLFPLH